MKKIILTFITIVLILSMTSCFETSSPNEDPSHQDPLKEDINNIIYHTLSFETNGGTNIAPYSAKELKIIPSTQKEGYRFEGWYLDPTLTQAVVYPLSIDKDMIIYAKWLKLKGEQKYNGCNIKFDARIYDITPNGFNIDRLAELGYNLTITVKYDVYYKKDYDVLLDIGYLGSPKYEISIVNSENIGQFKNNLSTNKESDTRTMTYQCSAAELRNQNIKLNVSTDNIQNKIYFDNIVVTYEFK